MPKNSAMHFTTPMQFGLTAGNARKQDAAAPRDDVLARNVREVFKGDTDKKNKGEKGKGEDKAKGKGKGGKDKDTYVKVNGRQICFAYNNGNACDGKCGRLHICQRCNGTHPKIDTKACPKAKKGE